MRPLHTTHQIYSVSQQSSLPLSVHKLIRNNAHFTFACSMFYQVFISFLQSSVQPRQSMRRQTNIGIENIAVGKQEDKLIAKSNYDRKGLFVTFLFFFANVSRRAIYGMRSSKTRKHLTRCLSRPKNLVCVSFFSPIPFCQPIVSAVCVRSKSSSSNNIKNPFLTTVCLTRSTVMEFCDYIEIDSFGRYFMLRSLLRSIITCSRQ